MRARIALLLLAALLAAAPAHAFDLDELMRLLGARTEASATFTEQQHLAALDRPLRSSGELSWRAPDLLEKRTLEPRAETLRYAGGALEVERDGRRRRIDAQRVPQVLPLVESLRATLAGDRAALERLFAVTLEGDASAWRLLLAPLATARQPIRAIRVEGAAADVLGIVIERDNGDRSETRMQPRR